jgi:hypothetical protein
MTDDTIVLSMLPYDSTTQQKMTTQPDNNKLNIAYNYFYNTMPLGQYYSLLSDTSLCYSQLSVTLWYSSKATISSH